MSKKVKTLEELLAHLRDLRSKMERLEAAFLLGLVQAETEYMDLIEAGGFDTFQQFIRNYELCLWSRYDSFRMGLQHVTTEKALEMGAPAVIALAALRDKENLPAYESTIADFRRKHAGVYPTLETARKKLRQVDPRREQPRSSEKRTETERLQQENEDLRRQNAELKQQLSASQKRVKALEKKLATSTRSTGKKKVVRRETRGEA